MMSYRTQHNDSLDYSLKHIFCALNIKYRKGIKYILEQRNTNETFSNTSQLFSKGLCSQLIFEILNVRNCHWVKQIISWEYTIIVKGE